MIQFANAEITPSVREMWQTCFEDTDDFLDIYFSRKYKEENTLVYIRRGKVVASLQMLPSTIMFYGRSLPFYYLMGLCTLPKHRKKGYMEQLINMAHQVMQERNIPLSILVPAEEWLFGFYEKYNYVQVFDKGTEPLYPLKKILSDCPDMQNAYQVFKDKYEAPDFYVEKTFSDFETIVEEYKNDKCPDKYNLAAMARIIDRDRLLSLYAKGNQEKSFIFKIDDERYKIVKGMCEKTKAQAALFNADDRLLCRLLFGYKTNELDRKQREQFPERQPIINFMLE